MAERPIILSSPMVRALLREAQPKTQTRRTRGVGHLSSKARLVSFNPETGTALFRSGKRATWSVTCPYGVPGDRLWVKENFRLRADQDDKPPSQDWWKKGAWYEADGNCEPSGCAGGAGKLRPSIHMPRWASRITLELTDVRVERLGSITEDDARAEGVEIGQETPVRLIVKERGKVVRNSRGVVHDFTYRGAFCRAWDGMHGNGSWDADPWVWVLSFRRVAQAQEAAGR